jgi:hypothetical protein
MQSVQDRSATGTVMFIESPEATLSGPPEPHRESCAIDMSIYTARNFPINMMSPSGISLACSSTVPGAERFESGFFPTLTL